MKPKQPLPTERPFITFLTCTYRRPHALAENMKSIARQTLAHEIEQIIIPDYIGVGPNDSVYGRLPKYINAVHGEYVHVLGDDDVLFDEHSVEKLKAFARLNDNPAIIQVFCKKGDTYYPKNAPASAMKEGDFDLCCYVIRRDVWQEAIKEYAHNYNCDWGFMSTQALQRFNVDKCPYIFAQGAVGGGRPEAVDW